MLGKMEEDKGLINERRKEKASECSAGFHAGFFGGGGENGATPSRGCGVCSPRKVLKCMCSEVASGGSKKPGD